ncbi:hypothetical protein [Persephonella sp.]|nr:hypothetical protein [Aquificota bacterium]
MLYVIIVMILIFIAIFAIQYKLASETGKPDLGQIFETTLLWSIISYVVIGIILFGITLIATTGD